MIYLSILLFPLCFHQHLPTSFQSLFNSNVNANFEEESTKSKILTLNQDVVISSAMQIRSEEIVLIGNSARLLFHDDLQPNLECSALSPNQPSTKSIPEQSQKWTKDKGKIAIFMFEVTNSTFSMSGVHAIMNSEGNRICSIIGSTVRFSSSSITSNGDSSPFLIRTSSNEGPNLGSVIILLDVTHHSRSAHLAPFVDLAIPQTDAATRQTEAVTIVGTGLLLDSKDLVGGTGPLFSFGLTEHDSSIAASGYVIRMETNLLQTNLVNMTSSSPFSPGKQLFGSEVCQRVAGCSMSHSTNHDSGTGMMSPNLGGSLTCLNTSFSSCIRERNTVKEFSFENRTQTHIGRLNNVTSDVTSVTFTLCTFDNMTVAVHKDYNGGGAILLHQTSSSLTIDTCFFNNCSCTGEDDDGGAVSFRCSETDGFPFSVTDSSFTNCSTFYSPSVYNCGGGICSENTTSATLTRCFFDNCLAARDGAVFLRSDSVSVSNCAFVACSTYYRGGAITFQAVQTLSLSFTQFRGCNSQNQYDAKDIFFDLNSSTQITSDMIQFCDSTSGTPNVCFQQDWKTKSSLVPQIDSTLTIKSLDASFDENEATVIVVTEKAVNGTMSVLLDGSNVPRLVHVVFGSDTTSSNVGQAVVSSGENGILPKADYTPRKATIKDYSIGISLGPVIFDASSTLDGWSTSDIVVKGAVLKKGSYWMLIVKGEDEWNVTLTRSDSTTLTGTASLSTSNAEVSLEWGTEYEVTKVMWKPEGEQTETEIELVGTVKFTTPMEPARIEGGGCSLNGKKDVAIVELMVLSRSSGEISSSGGIFNVTSTKCFVKFLIGSSEDSSHVVFGGNYELLSVGSGSSSIAVNSGIFVEVPHPPRITSFTPDTEVSSPTFSLSVSGEYLPSGSTFTVSLTSGHSLPVSFSSASSGTSTVKIGGSEEIQYKTEYMIESIIRKEDGKDDEHILFTSSTFTTPLGPTLSSVSCDFHSTNGNILNVSLSTARMPLEDFTLTLNTTETPLETISLTITSSDITAGFVLVEVYKQTDALKYGTEYCVCGMNSSSVVAVVSAQPFSTRPEPIRITSAECSLGGDRNKSAVVTLRGVKLGGEKSFNVTVEKVKETPSNGEGIVLSGTLAVDSSSATHTHSVTLFGNTNSPLSFDTKYLITEFTVDGEVSVVDADVTFSVPGEPARLTFLDSDVVYSADEKEVTISVSGIGMSGSFNVTLSVNSIASTNVTVLGTFDVDGTGVMKAILFDLSDAPVVDLSYNTRYEVIDVNQGSTPIFFENDLVFTTIPVPPRLLSISLGDSVLGINFVRLSFDWIALPIDSSFNLTLESVHSDGTTPHQKVLLLETGGSGDLAPLEAQLYPFETEAEKRNAQLEYETKYEVVNISKGSTPIHFENDNTTIQTPIEPARIEKCATRILNPPRTELVVSLEGRKLRSNLGFLNLSAESGNWTSIAEIETVDDTRCSVRFLTNETEDTSHVAFGKEYTLKAVSVDESNFVVNDGITIVVPFPPKITKMEFVFSNTLHTGCFVVLTGTDLIVGNSLNITLNDSLSFIATITSETEAKSSELSIGWPTTLQHNTKYEITSIEAMGEDDGETLLNSSIANTTGSLPDPFVILVDSGSSDSTPFCGDKARSCHSIEDGWKIVEEIGLSSLSISIIDNTTQKEQVRIGSEHVVKIESGPSQKPELFVSPSSSSSKLDGEGMIEVVGGSLWIHQVDVVLSDSPSLIFVQMVGGHLAMDTCSLTSTSSEMWNSGDSLCSWNGGAIVLEHATTTITSSTFSELRYGAIDVEGGSLTIHTSSFSSNSPHASSFASVRHNIRCSGEGLLKIESLKAGDGSSDKRPHLWLSHEDCSLSGDDVNINAPFFIPTLSSSSTSTLNKTKTDQAFNVTINGETLIPCSLLLEVFEKKKDVTEGQLKQFPLTQDSTSHFNETTIVLSLPLSSLSSFDDSLEWRGRLGFGKDEITTTSFVIQKNTADRRAQAVSENMKWWLPVVIAVSVLFLIVLVIVIVCWRRRRNNQKKGPNKEEMRESDTLPFEEEKMEIVTDNRIGVNSVHTIYSSKLNADTKMNDLEASDSLISFENAEEVLPCNGDLKKTVFVSKDRTLYNALHSENKWEIQVRQAQLQLVKGLKDLAKRNKDQAILRALTAHNILFDAQQNVCLKLNLDITSHAPQSVFTQPRPEQDHHNQEPKVATTNDLSPFQHSEPQPVNEGVRWYAPEVISNKPHMNSVHGAVFSLGLILWEMETGFVPYGEQDAVNASRQIESGVTPRLELVKNEGMRELISQCLSLNPDDRPDLDTIEKTLALIPADKSNDPKALVPS
ncbi:hypothetical protein BLNAU_9083 [Blattamonas nauphoetae]|uniref:Uncharacterized protein n=1 Tax=Blattamonas nauphoetae TaxID=2049346 RepID=A0ABQ9XWR5_9EUKA|nr:hypothetical protein BLNAU_9083 [Blattamonas nauphoetae]